MAVSSEKLTWSHIPRGARCGCVPSKAQGWPLPQGQTDTSVSPAQPAQVARVPLHPFWVQRRGSAQGTGHSNPLAEFPAGPKSASLHFSWAYSRLCLMRHMWVCAGPGSPGGLCNPQSSICRLREKCLLRCLLGSATQRLAIKNKAITY